MRGRDLTWKFLRPHQRLERADVLLIAAGLLLTCLISIVLGHKRIFWEDEMLGWMLLRDPSWHHMVYAWKMGADGGGFLFYLTGRMWLKIFGPSALAFRLYSAACFGLSFWVTWITARRFYATAIVAFALFNTWFFNPYIVAHMAEGRFYGLFLLATSLTVAMAVRAYDEPGTSARLCLLTCLAHGLLTTSHVLGVMYSGAVVFAVFLSDRWTGRFRPLLYLSAAVSWLLLLPERAAIIATAKVGVPHFWTPKPNLSRFLGCYTGFSGEIAVVEFVLIAWVAYLLVRGARGRLAEAFAERRPVYVIVTVLALIPILISALSLVGPSLLFNRYMMPLSLISVFLTAEPLLLILESVRVSLSGAAWRAAPVVYVVLLLVWDIGHVRRFVISPLDYTQALTARLPHNLPVLVEDAFMFTEVMTAQHNSGVHYTYLLDWPYSISDEAPRTEVTQYHLMENWRKVGYFSGSIVDRDQFLKNNPRFIVIRDVFDLYPNGDPLIGNFLYARFSNDPAYEVHAYGVKNETGLQDLWMVSRKAH